MKVVVNEEARARTTLGTMDLIKGKIYDVIGISEKSKWYQIIDESEEDYLYPPSLFDIVEEKRSQTEWIR